MNAWSVRFLLSAICMLLAAGCANIVPPSGGAKDVTPPKLVSVTPKDSLVNTRATKVRFDFDEYINLSDASSQVIISPLLPVPPTVASLGKHLTITVPDSLLEENTTYRITLGTAVRDLNENNIYKGKGYIFSTGAYFDSLSISGKVLDASTGLPDTAATIVLYNSAENDSAVTRKRPRYATHADAGGNFSLQGLPGRSFKIYALRDKNANLLFDDRTEWIAFNDSQVASGADTAAKITLRTFPQTTDTVKPADASRKELPRNNITGYNVLVDTSDIRRRSQDITAPLDIAFSKKMGHIEKEKIFLSSDSGGVTTEAVTNISLDSIGKLLSINTRWAENTIYTLRLQKGFAKDTAGNDLLPGRYVFRTRRDDDYAKLQIHMPTKYYGDGFVLQVTNETDTIYRKPILDSNISLVRIKPGNYKLLVIEDRNKNGHWDTGDLFGKKQPERVIPFERTIMLKPGWENQEDFESAPKPVPVKSPQKNTLPTPK